MLLIYIELLNEVQPDILPILTQLHKIPSIYQIANLLVSCKTQWPIPPEAKNTNGVKELCSTSRRRDSQALFFASCMLIEYLLDPLFEGARRLKTLTSV